MLIRFFDFHYMLIKICFTINGAQSHDEILFYQNSFSIYTAYISQWDMRLREGRKSFILFPIFMIVISFSICKTLFSLIPLISTPVNTQNKKNFFFSCFSKIKLNFPCSTGKILGKETNLKFHKRLIYLRRMHAS